MAHSTLKKAEVERWLLDKLGSWLDPLGFKPKRAKETKRWEFARTQSGAAHIISLDAGRWPSGGVSVGFPHWTRIEPVQLIVDRWKSNERFLAVTKETRVQPSAMASGDAIKNFPGGSSVCFYVESDFAKLEPQCRAIVDATVVWLEKYSDIDRVRSIFESATTEELQRDALSESQRDLGLMAIYAYEGKVDRLREYANARLKRPLPKPWQEAALVFDGFQRALVQVVLDELGER